MKQLIPPTPDRSAKGRAERKLDLANRLQGRADEYYHSGDLDRGDFYQDLSAEALADYHDLEGIG